MLIDSFRFGTMEIPDDRVIEMKRPILGFENLTRFCLVEREDLLPFVCLQSCEDPKVAFLATNPAVFFPDYRIEVNPREIAELEIERLEEVETYVIVTVTDNPEETSVNLQGPIIINTGNRFAKQLVLVNSDYRVHHNLLEATEALEQQSEPAREPVSA
jgi:flagellar assembly factor FliW